MGHCVMPGNVQAWCSRADRQTDRQTHTHTLIAILRTSTRKSGVKTWLQQPPTVDTARQTADESEAHAQKLATLS